MRRLFISVYLFSVFISTWPLLADVSLPKILSSDMVLQREQPVAIFGKADPEEKITVQFNGQEKHATADADGEWKLFLDPMKANAEGQKLIVRGNNTIELNNILIGEVWLGSGQSNMGHKFAKSENARELVESIANDQIRLFFQPRTIDPRRQRVKQPPREVPDYIEAWKVCEKKSAWSFSAVLYYMGARLHEELDVPVGLILAAQGATSIGPWQAENGLYRAYIKPIVPFTLKGIAWYQGENEVGKERGLKYEEDMITLVEGWRKAWSRPEMPFYYVQLAPCSKYKQIGSIPKIWEAQAAALKIPNTGMAVITDTLTDMNDLHPVRKKPVGERLALWALAKTYGKDLVYSGPLFKSQKIEGNTIRLTFAHSSGLKSRDGKPLNEFKIAGPDGKFVEAKAEIDGDAILVSADGIASPKVVQFGWHKSAQPNLVNGAGLPASPFQTDNWQGGIGQ